MTRKTLALRLTAATAVLVVATGCGSNNFRDVKGVKSHDPDKIEVYNNADKNPNVTLLCIHGVAFYTTTRDYNSIGRVLEWDHLCPGYVGK